MNIHDAPDDADPVVVPACGPVPRNP